MVTICSIVMPRAQAWRGTSPRWRRGRAATAAAFFITRTRAVELQQQPEDDRAARRRGRPSRRRARRRTANSRREQPAEDRGFMPRASESGVADAGRSLPRCARPHGSSGPRTPSRPRPWARWPWARSPREKPSLAASRSRSWPRGAGRTSPASPTSPKTMKPRGSGLPRRLRLDRQHHRQVGRRLADAHAADRVDEHVLVERGDAGMAMQHRQQHRQAVAVEADRQPARAAARRLSTSAWISTSSGRVPSSVDQHARARHRLAVLSTGRSRSGWRRPSGRFSVIANTPISLTAPKRFLIARTRRKLECVSPSK